MEKRQLEIIIENICQEKQISYQMFSDGWGIKLNKEDQTAFILGYHFPINNAVSSNLCSDKYMTSELLLNSNIPSIKNYFFYKKDNDLLNSDYLKIEKLFDKYQKIVCKPNSGTGGKKVYLVNNKKELKKSIKDILVTENNLIISKYLNIQNEYRAIILNNEVKLIYSKQIDYLIGDGIHNIEQLLKLNNKEKLSNDFKNKVLEKDEKWFFNWKHNLGLGAKPIIVENTDLINKIAKLALEAGKVIGINFASVDIIEVDNQLLILEINSGVMMEAFSKLNDNNYQIAKKIYKEAILKSLEN